MRATATVTVPTVSRPRETVPTGRAGTRTRGSAGRDGFLRRDIYNNALFVRRKNTRATHAGFCLCERFGGFGLFCRGVFGFAFGQPPICPARRSCGDVWRLAAGRRVPAVSGDGPTVSASDPRRQGSPRPRRAWHPPPWVPAAGQRSRVKNKIVTSRAPARPMASAGMAAPATSLSKSISLSLLAHTRGAYEVEPIVYRFRLRRRRGRAGTWNTRNATERRASPARYHAE